MTAEQFTSIRLSLDQGDARFAAYVKKRKAGPGRPPSGKVTQAVLAQYLEIDTRSVIRYEGGAPIPRAIELVMECLAREVSDKPGRRGKSPRPRRPRR